MGLNKSNLIELTLQGLKTRMNENGTIFVQHDKGFVRDAVCKFNNPASDKEIQNTEKELGFSFPKDYRKFLTLHNGAIIFGHEYYGGGMKLFSIEESINEKQTTDYLPKGYYPIGYYEGEYVYININKLENGNKNYLAIMDELADNEEVPINMNFEIWFDRFIIAQGERFWNWPIYTADNYYEAHEIDE